MISSGSASATAISVRGPMAPSWFTMTAFCRNFAARPVPLFPQASMTAQSTPLGRSWQRHRSHGTFAISESNFCWHGPFNRREKSALWTTTQFATSLGQQKAGQMDQSLFSVGMTNAISQQIRPRRARLTRGTFVLAVVAAAGIVSFVLF